MRLPPPRRGTRRVAGGPSRREKIRGATTAGVNARAALVRVISNQDIVRAVAVELGRGTMSLVRCWRVTSNIIMAVVAAAVLSVLSAAPAHADKRVALVVGNSAYKSISPL